MLTDFNNYFAAAFSGELHKKLG